MRYSTDAIEAELVGSKECRARGIITRGNAPVFAMCRALLGSGFDPDRALHVYRGKSLALTVRSIGEGAKLTVTDAHGRPKIRRMRPQDWARLQEARTLPSVQSPCIDPSDDVLAADEAATDESDAG